MTASQSSRAWTLDKQVRRAAHEAELGRKQLALPPDKYGVIIADPGWRFEPFSRVTGMDRAADNHYATSSVREIAAIPVGSIAADDCVLLLWATPAMLLDAARVMLAWGFTYKTELVWKKDRLGLGYWARNQHESLLLGVRGRPPAPAPGTQSPSIFEAPRRRHSEKPSFAHEWAEKHYPSLRKVELFARSAREGWDAWGAEAPEPEVHAAFENLIVAGGSAG